MRAGLGIRLELKRFGDFSTAFLTVTVISPIAAPVCLGFPINAGEAMSGHRHKTGNIEFP
jgi:hypothetical protein